MSEYAILTLDKHCVITIWVITHIDYFFLSFLDGGDPT